MNMISNNCYGPLCITNIKGTILREVLNPAKYSVFVLNMSNSYSLSYKLRIKAEEYYGKS